MHPGGIGGEGQACGAVDGQAGAKLAEGQRIRGQRG